MAIVNSITIERSSNIKTCTSQIGSESKKFFVARVIFDLYFEVSLKWETEDSRRKGNQIQNKVDSISIIRQLEASKHVSHVKFDGVFK